MAASKVHGRTGCSVMESLDGRSAMELLRAHKDDLDAILVDVTCQGSQAGRSSKKLAECGTS